MRGHWTAGRGCCGLPPPAEGARDRRVHQQASLEYTDTNAKGIYEGESVISLLFHGRLFVFPSRLLQFHQTVVKGSGGLPDELLYGRMGYLYSLVFINQQLGQDRIPLQYIQQVSTTHGTVSQRLCCDLRVYGRIVFFLFIILVLLPESCVQLQQP